MTKTHDDIESMICKIGRSLVDTNTALNDLNGSPHHAECTSELLRIYIDLTTDLLTTLVTLSDNNCIHQECLHQLLLKVSKTLGHDLKIYTESSFKATVKQKL
jgi:hypothetical protein